MFSKMVSYYLQLRLTVWIANNIPTMATSLVQGTIILYIKKKQILADPTEKHYQIYVLHWNAVYLIYQMII